ncbi:aldehyde dehydrogenase family protein [Nocardia sp. CA-135953]|uniref:aldehyde dehydrogenase family protein n=1 Tax=Nocardia sp. CA-135953 TaxID=3239978 RepID=UPI003D99A55C
MTAVGTPPRDLLIDGELVGPSDGATLPVVDPSIGEVVREVWLGGPAEAEAAIAASRRAFDEGPWPHLPVAERAAALHRLGDLIEADTGRFTDLVATEVGTPRLIAEAGQVRRPMDHYRDMIDRGARGLDRELADLPGPPRSRQIIAREPRGVVSAITPWNAPHLLNLWKVAPGLVTGNTMVLKPSPEAPGCALLLGELALEAGLPAGVLNVITGGGEVGRLMVGDPRVDMIAFTGSSGVGRGIAATAGGSLKHALLELGGKSALLALPDADVPSMVAAAMRFVTLAGQGCGLLTRILVPDSLHDRVVAAFVAALGKVRVGSAHDPQTMMGPVISAGELGRIEASLADAVHEGASIAFGGKRPDVPGNGYFLEPTLLVDVRNDMTVAREEIFGPVISVIRYSGDPDEGVALANDSEYGLVGAVWTRDVDLGVRLARRIRAGQVRVNATASTTEGPFGGYKQSGVGRECGDLGVAEYTEIKYLGWGDA